MPETTLDATETAPDEVTPVRALMLANHARYVQGGVSDPDREADRARAQLAQSPGSIDWDTMAEEVRAALNKLIHTPDVPARVERILTGDAALEAAGGNTDAAAAISAGEVDMELVRRYKTLKDAQAASEAEAKAIKDEVTKLEGELVEMFSEAGVQNINVDGKTVYLHRSVFAQRCEGVDVEMVKAALRAAGADELISETVNSNTLSAWVRELTQDDDAPGLPEPVVGILEPGERYGVRVRASATRAKRPARTS